MYGPKDFLSFTFQQAERRDRKQGKMKETVPSFPSFLSITCSLRKKSQHNFLSRYFSIVLCTTFIFNVQRLRKNREGIGKIQVF